MITENYVTFEQAKAIKELGFPQDMIGGYYSEICKEEVRGKLFLDRKVVETMYACPTLSLSQKWLREDKKLIIELHHAGGFYQDITYSILGINNNIKLACPIIYYSDELALSAGIDKCIKILKNN